MTVILIGIAAGVIGYYIGSFLTIITFYLFRLLSESLFGTSMESFPILFLLVDSGLLEMVFGGGVAGYFAQSKEPEQVRAWMLGLFCALVVIVVNLLILRSSEATPTGPASIDAKVIVGLVLNLPAGALGGLLGARLAKRCAA